MSDHETMKFDARQDAAFDKTMERCWCGGNSLHEKLWRPCPDYPDCITDSVGICHRCVYVVCPDCGGTGYVPKERGEYMEREAWLEKRRTGIAVSDLSVILSLNPYKSPIQIYMDKLGLVEDREETLAMKLGRRLEPVIGELFTERTALQIVPGEITQHPTRPLILGTPDFLVVDRPAGMEAKTTAWAREDEWGEEMTDLVPMQYLIQCLGYLEITEREEWFLSLLIGGSRDFRIYRIPRNAEQQKRLMEFAENWWREHVEKQIPPPLDATPSSAAYLKRMFPRHADEQIVPADEETAKLIADYAHEKEMLDALETRTDALRNQICGKIGDAAGIACATHKITWKATKDSASTDWKTVATKFNPPPELLAQHTITKPGARRFLLKENKP